MLWKRRYLQGREQPLALLVSLDNLKLAALLLMFSELERPPELAPTKIAVVALYTGAVPKELGALDELMVLRLDNNYLTGEGEPVGLLCQFYRTRDCVSVGGLRDAL